MPVGRCVCRSVCQQQQTADHWHGDHQVTERVFRDQMGKLGADKGADGEPGQRLDENDRVHHAVGQVA